MATLTGTSGNDTLSGTSSADTLVGSGGNDFYDGAGGSDTLDFRGTSTATIVDFTDGTISGGFTGTFTNIERVLAGNGNDHLIGGAGAQNLSGRAGADTLEGGAGNDWLWGGGGGLENQYVFREIGTANADQLGDFISGADKIVLDASVMTALGAEGNFAAGDARFAANTSGTAQDASDRVIYETDTRQIWYDPDGNGAAARQLIATLQSGATLTATDIVVEGAGTPPPPGGTTGTESDDTLVGTPGDDTINGLGGDDSISGLAGHDSLSGGDGNDSLDGGENSDTLDGGLGNDTYFVNAGQAGDFAPDQIVDAGGVDTVVALSAGLRSSWTLGSGLENLEVYGLSGTGNELDNVIRNNEPGDENVPRLNGMGGNDTLVGSADGFDIFVFTGDYGNDVVDGGGPGADEIDVGDSSAVLVDFRAGTVVGGGPGGSGTISFTNVARAAGGEFNDTLIGADGANGVFGNGGNDVLNGGAGNDFMNGGAGADSFVFDQTPGTGNSDQVIDFASGTDHIHLDATAMPALGPSGAFSADDARFFAAAGAASGHDADDRVVYDTSTGNLYYDSDGNGAAAAQLVGTILLAGAAAPLVATDIVVDNGGSAPGDQHLVGTPGDDNLAGGSGNDTIEGLDGLDTLSGAGGNDLLVGGSGWDTVAGGAGQDTFAFAEFGSGMSDDITDFVSGTDTLQLDAAAFTAIGASGRFTARDGRFFAAPGASAGHDADDRLIYDTTSGILYYDADGNGSGGEARVAHLEGAPSLAATDIVVIDNGTTPPEADTFDNVWEALTPPLSGQSAVDSLISGYWIAWDRLNPSDSVIQYTFSVTEGQLSSYSPTAFTADEQTWARQVLGEATSVTGIRFEEVTNGDAAELHFAHASDLSGFSGIFTNTSNITLDADGHLTHYDADGYVYLLPGYPGQPGSFGYQTLLHEVGHALGLNHPHAVPIVLPLALDDNHHTVMTYNNIFAPVSTYQPLDVAALQWLYGTDGLGGRGAYADGTRPQLGSDTADSMVGGSGNDYLNGIRGADTLLGGAGNDFLLGQDGGAGDVLNGGDGDDYYYVDAGDTLIDPSGHDAVLSQGDLTLPSGLEDLTLAPGLAIVARGNDQNNVVTGNDNANVIAGLAGDDLLYGRGGDDSFDMAFASGSSYGNDTIDGGAGINTVDFSGAASGVTVDLNTGTASGGGTGGGGTLECVNVACVIGGDFADSITALANWAVDARLQGGAGQDTITGGNFNDVFLFAEAPGTANADIIINFTGPATLSQYWDKVTLDSSAYAEIGAVDFTSGDDRFYAAPGAVSGHDAGDRIIYDTSTGQLSYDGDGSGPGAAQIVATLQGAPALDASQIRIVNGLSQTGTSGNDVLTGTSRNDTIDGLGGNDAIYAGEGTDWLEGGSGTDTLEGGAGPDNFLFSQVGNSDLLLDFSSGQDHLWLSARAMTYLGAPGNFASADARFYAAAGATGGHDADDRIIYNTSTGDLYYDTDGSAASSAQAIAKLDGAPSLAALDITVYGARDASGHITGTEANDWLVGTLDNDYLDGGLRGNDTLSGSSGNDTLSGGLGQDSLSGNAGADVFILAYPGSENADHIVDFATSTDSVQLDASVMTALGASGRFAAADARFFSAPGATAGHDGSDRVVYDTATGNLWYDADGNGAGAAQLIATLDGSASLVATDIVVDNGSTPPPPPPGNTVNGTSGSDTLPGTSGNDTLNGLGGDDTLVGSAGTDFYDGGAGSDTLDLRATTMATAVDVAAGTIGGGFTGTLANIERVLAGNGDDSLTGGAGADNLSGRFGSDTLAGGAGNDWLWGGGGGAENHFVFHETGTANADRIGDFIAGADQIDLDNAAMTALGGEGAFTAGDARFFAGSGAAGGHDGDDRVVYDTSTGQLYYDDDGSGAHAAQLIATLHGAPTLAAAEISVV
jgi:Ca2+-binding RTX toxin-like protein